jgi:hypothetical protein
MGPRSSCRRPDPTLYPASSSASTPILAFLLPIPRPKEDAKMTPHEALREQLMDDLIRLHSLILRYADKAVKVERDQLEGGCR